MSVFLLGIVEICYPTRETGEDEQEDNIGIMEGRMLLELRCLPRNDEHSEKRFRTREWHVPIGILDGHLQIFWRMDLPREKN